MRHRFFLLKKILISYFVLALLAGCSMVETSPYVEAEGDDTRRLTIWALSDIQPGTSGERIYFENAIEDVNSLGRVDMGLMAGDLLASRSDRETFDWFVKTRRTSTVLNWFEIAGNHDARSQPLFSEYFPHPPYYGVAVGNILILMLSDISPASKTNISKEGFLWWKKMVLENQDKIIITVTHAQLRKSGLLGSVIKSRVIEDSARFEEVLEHARVVLWLSGHSHLPQGLANTLRIRPRFNNCCFVNVSSISKEPLIDSQSRMFVFTKGEPSVWIRSRNHTKQQFASGLNVELQLGQPFVWDGEEPVLILPRDV